MIPTSQAASSTARFGGAVAVCLATSALRGPLQPAEGDAAGTSSPSESIDAPYSRGLVTSTSPAGLIRLADFALPSDGLSTSEASAEACRRPGRSAGTSFCS